MYALKHEEFPQCPHFQEVQPSGLCLITVGNTLRGDDGIAVKLCDKLPEPVLNDICRFDLGPYTSYLGACLHGHKGAIIIDATLNTGTPGSITMIDLNALIEDDGKINTIIKSTHGFSLVDELRALKEISELPERLILLGVETGNVNSESISPMLQAKLPQLVSNLPFIVARILETLKKNA